MSMETSETDLDLIYMSDWSVEMQHNDDASTSSKPRAGPSASRVSYASIFPGVKDGNDGDSESVSRSSLPTTLPFGMKKNVIPTITTIYEPKFFEIYQQYYQYILHNEADLIMPNPGQQHLMSLCLNYLLSFSNWARDAVNGNWIRATLFENPDMRPEVRNGLAMILVYVFASARAADLRAADPGVNHDMFTVLMKAETGLGIVNKTSLKIYSDPFGYFNFVKTCISGLIDALAIPENERVSTQATKKTRRGSRNKDEMEAYHYVKNQLIALFQAPDSLQMAKDRITQVLEFWHVRGKSIRTERFTAVFSLPLPTTSASSVGSSSYTTDATTPVPLSSPAQHTPMYHTHTSEYGSSARGSGVSQNNPSSSRGSNRSSQGSLNVETQLQSQQQYLQYLQLQQLQHSMSNDNESVLSDSASTASRSPHPSFADYSTSARSSGAQNFRYTNMSNWSANEEGSGSNMPMQGHSGNNMGMGMGGQGNSPFAGMIVGGGPPQLGTPSAASASASYSFPAPSTADIAVPAMRCDRNGVLAWSATSTLLYDLDALQQSGLMPSSFFLVDEVKFKRFLAAEHLVKASNPTNVVSEDEMLRAPTFPLSVSYAQAATGYGSLDKILQRSGALMTSWSGVDFPQLKTFLEGWKKVQAQQRMQFQQQQQPQPRQSFIQAQTGIAPAGDGDDQSVASMTSSASRRTIRRRTTGAVDLKRDLARLQQMQLGSPTQGGTGSPSNASPNVSLHKTMSAAAIPPISSPTGMGMGLGSDGRSSGLNSGSNAMFGDGTVSLLDFWQGFHGISPAVSVGVAAGPVGRGVLLFERTNEVGLVLRAAPQYGLQEDLWCLYYPDDELQQFAASVQMYSANDTLAQSFAAFLMQLLPQTRVLLPRLMPEQRAAHGPLTVQYLSHARTGQQAAVPKQGPPPVSAGGSGAYRTIGSLDQNCHWIMSRFASESCFHELVLQ